MSGRLIAIAGPLAGATLPLHELEISVGRDETNLIALADPAVSARHCVLACTAERVTIRDLDPANPSFVNSLPAGDQSLADGDQIQIGGSLFVLKLAAAEEIAAADEASLDETAALAPFSIIDESRGCVRRRSGPAGRVDSARLARDLDALIRISGAINAVRGLVALERPLLALIADVVPASRGAIVLSGDRPDRDRFCGRLESRPR